MSHGTEIERARKMCAKVGATLNVLHQSGKLRGSAGIPDCYIQWPRFGRVTWWECKVGRDRLSDAQTAFVMRDVDCGLFSPGVIVGSASVVADWLEAAAAGKL